MKKRTPYCDNGKLSPLNDLQARLDRLKTLVPEQYKRNDDNNNYNSRRNKRNLTKEERWAKRISRRMELEETYGDESQRSACNVDEMMAMLNHAEAISSALSQDLSRERPNINNLNKINHEQKKLLFRIHQRRKYEYNNNNNNNNRRDDDNNNNVNHKDVHDTQQTVMHIDNNNDVTRNTYRNNAIERGINRILNNQQNMNEAIGRINNTRQSIQSYLHNVYTSNNNTNDDDQRRLRRHLNLQNALRLSNSSFANMSTWNVKYSEKEYSDCPICLDKMGCKQKVVSVHGTHIFHHQCIKRWFERSSLCPLCKRDCETKASSTYYAKK